MRKPRFVTIEIARPIMCPDAKPFPARVYRHNTEIAYAGEDDEHEYVLGLSEQEEALEKFSETNYDQHGRFLSDVCEDDFPGHFMNKASDDRAAEDHFSHLETIRDR